MTTDALQESLARAREAEERIRRLREISRRLLQEKGQDLRDLARAVLDSAIAFLGFERGFLLLQDVAHDGSGIEPASSGFSIFAARAIERGAGSREDPVLRDAPNPEFAVQRSAVRKAFLSDQAVALEDCLDRSDPSGAEGHRSVLCRPFRISRDRQAAIYLDRELGRGPISEEHFSALEDFAERCLPLLVQAFLEADVDSLRCRLEAPAASLPGGSPEESDEAIHELPGEIPSYHGIIGKSEKMQRIFQIIEKVKDSDLNLCIFGESGTGKELVARAIHDASRRRDRNFISENCGTIAENLLESELFGHLKGSFTGADEDRQGLFESAAGGTLFLDEIGDMSEGMQRKLLRVLQEGLIRPIGSKQAFKVDVRVICASNKNLRALVQSGTFRMDLFYRVNVISIEIPPLRDRLEDIPLLVAHFKAEVEKEEGIVHRFSESAMNAFLKYSWPGNARELRNVIRRVMVTCPRRNIVRKDVMPLLVGGQSAAFAGEDFDRSETQIILRVPRRESFGEIIDECERVVLLNALKECHWNKSKVVKHLQIPRQSLYNKIEKHKLHRKWE